MYSSEWAVIRLSPIAALAARSPDVSFCRQFGTGIVSNTRLTLRVDFGSKRSIGPGKIRLLEEIGRSGSISQAGRPWACRIGAHGC